MNEHLLPCRREKRDFLRFLCFLRRKIDKWLVFIAIRRRRFHIFSLKYRQQKVERNTSEKLLVFVVIQDRKCNI